MCTYLEMYDFFLPSRTKKTQQIKSGLRAVTSSTNRLALYIQASNSTVCINIGHISTSITTAFSPLQVSLAPAPYQWTCPSTKELRRAAISWPSTGRRPGVVVAPATGAFNARPPMSALRLEARRPLQLSLLSGLLRHVSTSLLRGKDRRIRSQSKVALAGLRRAIRC